LDNPRLSDTKGKSPCVGSSLQLPPAFMQWGMSTGKVTFYMLLATKFIEYVHL
jgi:hypothetical protein